MATAPQALSSYRVLLRAISRTFRGDALALTEGRLQARQQFEQNRGVADAGEASVLIGQAHEAAEFLRTSVVQAALNESGNYEAKLSQGGVLDQPGGSGPECGGSNGSKQ